MYLNFRIPEPVHRELVFWAYICWCPTDIIKFYRPLKSKWNMCIQILWNRQALRIISRIRRLIFLSKTLWYNYLLLLSLYYCKRISVCLSKDLANLGTYMVLLYREAVINPGIFFYFFLLKLQLKFGDGGSSPPALKGHLKTSRGVAASNC